MIAKRPAWGASALSTRERRDHQRAPSGPEQPQNRQREPSPENGLDGEQREREHAPLRAELEGAAYSFAAALTWRAQGHRKKAEDADAAERSARDEARGYRSQAVEAGRAQSQAETEAKGIEERLEAVESKRKQLVREDLLAHYRSQGVTDVVFAVPPGTADETLAVLDRYAELVREVMK